LKRVIYPGEDSRAKPQMDREKVHEKEINEMLADE
jgi:hypothetical protein